MMEKNRGHNVWGTMERMILGIELNTTFCTGLLNERWGSPCEGGNTMKE
jgi:hypothetical protein